MRGVILACLVATSWASFFLERQDAILDQLPNYDISDSNIKLKLQVGNPETISDSGFYDLNKLAGDRSEEATNLLMERAKSKLANMLNERMNQSSRKRRSALINEDDYELVFHVKSVE